MFLTNTKQNNINKMNNTELFKKYCLKGKLNNAKELLQTDSTINISVYGEFAFKYACAYN